MSAVIHDNAKRYGTTSDDGRNDTVIPFAPHWLPYTVTINGFVLGSYNSVDEIPTESLRAAEAMPDNTSLGQLIAMMLQ